MLRKWFIIEPEDRVAKFLFFVIRLTSVIGFLIMSNSANSDASSQNSSLLSNLRHFRFHKKSATAISNDDSSSDKTLENEKKLSGSMFNYLTSLIICPWHCQVFHVDLCYNCIVNGND